MSIPETIPTIGASWDDVLFVLFAAVMLGSALLVVTLALMHRYLFVLVDETARLRRARRSRTFTTGRVFGWRLTATVAAQLFIRTSERAERVYAAMCARGWKL